MIIESQIFPGQTRLRSVVMFIPDQSFRSAGTNASWHNSWAASGFASGGRGHGKEGKIERVEKAVFYKQMEKKW